MSPDRGGQAPGFAGTFDCCGEKGRRFFADAQGPRDFLGALARGDQPHELARDVRPRLRAVRRLRGHRQAEWLLEPEAPRRLQQAVVVDGKDAFTRRAPWPGNSSAGRAPPGGGDGALQVGESDRFGNVVVHSGGEAGLAVALHRVGGHREDGR